MTSVKTKHRVSKTRALDDLKNYLSTTDRPTKAGYERYAEEAGATPIAELYIHFGSWRGICQVLHLRTPKGQPPRGSKDEAITALRRARVDLGPVFSQLDYHAWAQKHGQITLKSILRLWGGQWSLALDEAGIAATRVRSIEAGPELEALIRTVCEENGGSLSVRGWNKCRPQGVPSAGRIADHYGGSWAAAVEAAELEPAYPARSGN